MYRFEPSLHSAHAAVSRLHLTLDYVVSSSPPAILPSDSSPCLSISDVLREKRCLEDATILKGLLSEFRHDAHDRLHQQYGKDMERSQKELDCTEFPVLLKHNVSLEMLAQYHLQCSERVRSIFISISDALCASKPRDQIIAKAGLWPHVFPRALLGLLASTNVAELSSPWRKVLTSYAQAIIGYQRSQCLMILALDNKIEELFKELDHIASSDGAIPSSNADWLLIQVSDRFYVLYILLNDKYTD